MTFTQHKEFRNAVDLKSLALEITNNLYPSEKLMETIQEYKQGARESDIRALIKDDSFADLIDRIANFVNQKQSDEFKDIMIQFIIDNNLVDDEELR
jgi:hypothetical protein